MDSPKTKVLVAAQWFPPAYQAGGPIRSVANLIHALHSNFEHEIEFFVFAGAYDLGDEKEMRDISTGTWDESTGGITCRVIYQKRNDWSKKRWNEIFDEVKPDVLYLNSLFSLPFALRPLKIARSRGVKTVLAPRGMLGEGALMIKPLKKFVFLSLARTWEIFRGVIFHASNNMEAQEIKIHIHNAKVIEARNFPDPTIKLLSTVEKRKNTLNLLCLGRVHPVKNLYFALKVLSEMDLSSTHVKVNIVGPDEDTNYLNSLLSLSNENLEITFLGAIKHSELEQVFIKTHFLLQPSSHENFGHSIVESWGYGRGVIISDKTPWNDLKSSGLGYDLELNKEVWTKCFEEIFLLNSEDLSNKSAICRNKYEKLIFDTELLEANLNLFKS
ncbi:MAG: hypothetical protein COA49_03045 [Bacteroidetes bacterium]|nr:MAG: hypothetical protein COA49_03045 [Bacteroidota bacterium]